MSAIVAQRDTETDTFLIDSLAVRLAYNMAFDTLNSPSLKPVAVKERTAVKSTPASKRFITMILSSRSSQTRR